MKKTFDWTDPEFIALVEDAYNNEGLGDTWPTEREAVQFGLEEIGKSLSSKRFAPVAVLGVGGSGIVLRVSDALFPDVDNALKFPRPVQGKVRQVAEMLEKEMKFLSNLRHPGIVKILHYKTLSPIPKYETLPFYLMEAVEGHSSKKYMQRADVTVEQFVSVVQECAAVIRYLHHESGKEFVHLDIKPENIVVSHSGRPIMIDLGTCKRVVDDTSKTLVACTRSIAHPELVRKLAEDPSDNNRAEGELSRSTIDPKWDLWALGRTILSWMGVDYANGHLEKHAIAQRLEPYTRKYLLLVAARLLTYSPPHWLSKNIGLSDTFIRDFQIETSVQLCDILDRLTLQKGPIAAIEELKESGSGTLQAAPGIHVANTERLQMLLGHRLFRRLGAVTQLGVVSQVFPSAKHTRREHSLGTYANVCRIIRTLYIDGTSPLFRQIIEAEDIRALLLTALLHDIGQFPLAHELEEIDSSIFDHDKLSESMLKGVWKTGRSGGRQIKFESFTELFTKWGVSSDRVLAILAAKSSATTATYKDKLLRSIISGPIDADKLDYLLRDARHTDVPYPNGIDVDRLYRCLTTIVVPRINATENVPALGIYSKGRVAAEFMTLARYAMFSQVYWHHTVRAHKAMLNRAVSALLVAQENDRKIEELRTSFILTVWQLPEIMYGRRSAAMDSDLFPVTENEGETEIPTVGLGSDLAPTDAFVIAWLRDRLVAAKRPESQLLDRVLARNIYKRLWVWSRESVDIAKWDELVKNWSQLDRSKRHQVFRNIEQKVLAALTRGSAKTITSMSAEDALGQIEQKTAAQVPWLVVDIPVSRPGSEVPLHYVLESHARRMRKDDRVVGELQQSPVWKQYAKELQQVAGRIRVFCDPALLEFLDASLDQPAGFELLDQAVQTLNE